MGYNVDTIDDLLRFIVETGSSDLHLTSDAPPRYRLDGELRQLDTDFVVTARWLERQLEHMTSKQNIESYAKNKELDFAYGIEGLSRFRVNVFVQRQSPSMVCRVIPERIRTLKEIGAPDVLNDLVKKRKGLILVTGPTGSGKSTTLTAMIDAINTTRREHIVTIEDPIEFVHQNKKSLVSQREVGVDTKSFGEALKRVLRQDPDVILIGELRDAETISIALTAAETGHLVFGTLHTQSSSKTIDRVIDSFPAEQQNQVKSQLADTLQAVVSQMLVKKKGGGRCVATEILVSTNAVQSNIREGNISALYSEIQTGAVYGMHTLDSALKDLVANGLVDRDEVIDFMRDKKMLSGIQTQQEWN